MDRAIEPVVEDLHLRTGPTKRGRPDKKRKASSMDGFRSRVKPLRSKQLSMSQDIQATVSDGNRMIHLTLNKEVEEIQHVESNFDEFEDEFIELNLSDVGNPCKIRP